MRRIILLIGILCSFVFISDAQKLAPPGDLETYYSSLKWRSIGPFRGGRSCAVTGVPGKPELYYFGSTGGGVWKTNNGGRTWENISDGYFGGSIGSVAVSDSDQNVIYAGGGEKTVRGNVSFGYGVWKSIDAGKSWENMGLTQSRHIPRIRIHPKDPNTVYVASLGNLFAPNEERGVFKSTDGGETWNKVLYVSENAGAVDLIIDPNNSRILYASTWNVRRTPYSLSSGGKGSAIWKSTDSGESWTDLSANEGLPTGVWGISGIAVSPLNSERIWAIIENQNGGVFRSDDGGMTWDKVNSERSLRQRAWYYTRIYADTKDENTVYVVNVRYHKSTDGGRTFSTHVAPHGDHHDLWIAPENPERMIIADDGGAQVTYDGGETWSTYYNQPTAQFYRITTDNHFPYRIYAAQQDNSTVRILHRTTGRSIGEDDWEPTAGCECGHIAIDPQNNEIVYGGCYGGSITRLDHESNIARSVNVWPDNPMGHGAGALKYRFQWNFPIFFSKHDPNKLYTASNHLHLSTDEGQSWDVISPDLTKNDTSRLKSSGGPITQDNTSVEYYCTIFAADESPLQEGVIWAGSDDGLIHLTTNGGETWENVTPPDIPKWLMINSIEPDPHNADGCYFAGTLYKSGDFSPYIYKTEDRGKSWTKIVDGIMPEHFTRVVRADPYVEGILYAGTETGMYISFDDGNSWNSFQLNLPVVPITDLTIKEYNLIAATQGRSIWLIDDLSVIHQAHKGIMVNSNYIYKPLPAFRIPGGSRAGDPSLTSGQNRPSGVMVYYYLNDMVEEDSVLLHFYNPSGELIRSFSNKADDDSEKMEVKIGANMFNWDLSYPDAERFEDMIFWSGSLSGPEAVPGTYRVILESQGEKLDREFEILPDPRLKNSQADYELQFQFISEVNDKVSEAHRAIKSIRSIRDQLTDYSSRIEGHSEIVEKISQIDSSLTAVEEALYQTKNQSRQDPLNFPIRLTNKLAHLNGLVQRSDLPPTDQSISVKDELIGNIDKELSKYYRIIESDIPGLNAMIHAQKIEAIHIPNERG